MRWLVDVVLAVRTMRHAARGAHAHTFYTPRAFCATGCAHARLVAAVGSLNRDVLLAISCAVRARTRAHCILRSEFYRLCRPRGITAFPSNRVLRDFRAAIITDFLRRAGGPTARTLFVVGASPYCFPISISYCARIQHGAVWMVRSAQCTL